MEGSESSHVVGHHLKLRQRLGYGLGHVLNDLCASMWFTYLLLFFHKVLSFDNVAAGVVLLAGQIADGFSTLFVGYFADSPHDDNMVLCRRYGRRKAWHLLGTVCVLVSFPFIFLKCLGGCAESADQDAKLVYYVSFVVVFQFGWAATQISHLSLIPDMSPLQEERTGLTAIRYAMTVASNIAIYLVTWIFLGTKASGGDANNVVGPDDADSFRNVMLVAISLGAACSAGFHMLVHMDDESNVAVDVDNVREHNRVIRKMTPLDWVTEPRFYHVAVVYMATRLFVNLTAAYIPLYLQITLRLHAESVATVPLVMYLSGLLASAVMRPLNSLFGRSWCYISGAAVGAAGCVWVRFEGISLDADYEVYAVAVLLGAGASATLITSLSLTADLIGANTESGAFVYGCMSLTDKFSNGAAVVLIQKMIPEETDPCEECRLFFRDVILYACGGAAVLGALAMLSLAPFQVDVRRRDGVLDRREAYDQLEGSKTEEPQQQVRPHEGTPLIN